MDRSRLVFVSAAVVGASTTVFVWWWTNRQKEIPPSKWRRIGELTDLVCYPIKSFGPVRLNSMECTQLGVKSGWMRDRTLMVIDSNGQFVSGRQVPRMVQISPIYAGSVLTLEAPGMQLVSVDLAQLSERSPAVIFDQAVPSCDCGEEVAQWLSRFLLQEDTGLRLVYYPFEKSYRDVRKNVKIFPLTVKADTGAYPDVTSYTLENEASIADLNSRLEDPVTASYFRPNFVVNGTQALEEDTWDWLMIGDVVFHNIKPCTRCIFTTTDPETGIRHPKFEPLKTLRSYRKITNTVFRPFSKDMPVMGIHLGLRSSDREVHLGDPVYVSEPGRKDNFYQIMFSPESDNKH